MEQEIASFVLHYSFKYERVASYYRDYTPGTKRIFKRIKVYIQELYFNNIYF